jgi:hypothetical protein
MRIGPPDWELGMGLTTEPKNKFFTKYYKGSRTWTDSLDKRPDLAQDRQQCRALVNTVMNLRVP